MKIEETVVGYVWVIETRDIGPWRPCDDAHLSLTAAKTAQKMWMLHYPNKAFRIVKYTATKTIKSIKTPT